MRRKVIADDDRSGVQFGCKNVPNVCGEGLSIRCPFNHPWRDQTVVGQARYERLSTSCAEGRTHFQALAAQAATSQAGEVCFDRCFVRCPAVAACSDERE